MTIHFKQFTVRVTLKKLLSFSLLRSSASLEIKMARDCCLRVAGIAVFWGQIHSLNFLRKIMISPSKPLKSVNDVIFIIFPKVLQELSLYIFSGF